MRLTEAIKQEFFGHEAIARAMGISRDSAKVAATRWVKKGRLVRLKRNLYVLKERWKGMGLSDKLRAANLLQVPSYVSLSSALGFYGLTTQVQRDYVESIAVVRTREFEIAGNVFRYSKIDPKLYFGFTRRDGMFVADPEKAILDILYLASYGRYSFDADAVDWDKIDRRFLNRMIKKFPERTRKFLENNHERFGSA